MNGVPPTPPWAALEAASCRRVPRTPFAIDRQTVGSVADAHLSALSRWPDRFALRGGVCELLVPAAERDAALAEVHAALHADGLIRAWRNETYAIVAAPNAPPLALIERAAARFWGTLTFGAHCNGYVADAQGQPTHLWIARRSWHKPTDPGRLDNLVGGGVPHGQSPFEALVREGFEEAGLDAPTMRRATPGSVIALACDIAEGFMHEHLHAFDLRLPEGVVPANQDGEVAELRCLPVAEAIERAAAGEMTIDAALVTLDFALRHDLLPQSPAAALAARLPRVATVGHQPWSA